MVKKKIVKKAPEQAAPPPQSGESEESIAAQLHEQGGFCIQLCERAAAQANGSLEEALAYLMEHMDDDKELCAEEAEAADVTVVNLAFETEEGKQLTLNFRARVDPDGFGEIGDGDLNHFGDLWRARGDRSRSGATIWAASVLFAHWALTEQPDLFRGKKVLELGSGVGVGGIAVAHLAEHVTLSDYQPDVVQELTLNAELNSLQNTEVQLVDWCESPTEQEQYDVVIGCDVMYEPEIMQPLVSYLLAVLRPGGLYIAFSEETRAGNNAFIGTASEKTAECTVEATQMGEAALSGARRVLEQHTDGGMQASVGGDVFRIIKLIKV